MNLESGEAAALHEEALVIDCHTDVHLHMLRERGLGAVKVLKNEFYPRWKAGGVDAAVLSTMAKFGPDAYPYRTDPLRNFLLMADAVSREIEESPDCFYRILEPDDIERHRGDGRVGLLLGLEGAEPVGTDPNLLRVFHALGLRIMNLTWHQRNLVADGVSEPSPSGLSNLGREVVREMNRLGIMIDVSHLAPRGLDDVLACSTAPVIASHSNAREICSHERNLSDEHLRAIAAAGGLVGAVFIGRFVAAENPAVSDVVRHIVHMRAVAGADHIVIGPDFTDLCQDLIISARRVAGPNQPTAESSIPYAEGLETIERLPNLTAALAEAGFSRDEIRDILGGNFLRYFRAVREGI